MVTRLDVAFRAQNSAIQFRINYNGGGYDTITISDGLYWTAELLAAEIETQLTAQAYAGATWDVSITDDVFTIDSQGASTWIISWDSIYLGRWVGHDYTGGTTTATATSWTGDNPCGGRLTFIHPWGESDLGWEWSVKRHHGDNRTGAGVKLGQRDLWETLARVDYSEITRWNRIRSYMLRGMPVQWTQDTSNSNPWAYSEWFGYVRAHLDSSQTELQEAWTALPLLGMAQVPLRFQVWVS